MNLEKEPRDWEPILSGVAAERALEAVDAIAADLDFAESGNPPANRAGGFETRHTHSLAFGHAGIALFYAYLDRARAGDEAANERAESFLTTALQGMGEAAMLPGLMIGFSGIGWAFEHLRDQFWEPDDEDDPSDQIDEAIEILPTRPGVMQWEWMDGLAGCGLYLLERSSRRSRESAATQLLERLMRDAETSNEGARWRSMLKFATRYDQQRPDVRNLYERGLYCAGVSHGQAGLIGLFAAYKNAGLAEALASQMLEATTRWLLGHGGAGGEPGFPEWIAFDQKLLPKKVRNTGWCNGNIAIATVLHHASRVAGNEAWSSEALSIARHEAHESPADVEPFNRANPTLCHGSLGKAQLFNRLYQSTDDALFADAALAWYQHALDMRRPGTGTGGFTVDEPGEAGLANTRGFLMGAAGVGLALLAGVAKVDPRWDRVLLASL